MTVEAFLLSQIDEMDAKMNLMEQLRRKMTEEGFKWSEYQRPLERYLYLSGLTEEAKTEGPVDPPAPIRQKSLF
jgi:3'-5' exoribonuclease